MENIQIIIMAAGKGKRMNTEIPKVLIPFNGKPMVEYIVEACFESGIKTKPILVVGHGRDLVMEYFGDRVNYAIQENQLGTGDAVKSAKNIVPQNIEHIIVLNGDQPNITSKTILNLAETHIKNNKLLTMATVLLPDFDDWHSTFYHWGRILRDTQGRILEIVEYKDATDEQKLILEVNPSYFCFEKTWLFEKLEYIKNDNNQAEYYLTDLVKYATKETQIPSIEIEMKEALGINTIEQLLEIEKLQ